MKNKIKFIFALLVLSVFYAFAQDTDTSGTGSGTSTDVAAYFMSPGGVVALIVFLTGWLTTHLIISDAVFLGIHVKQWISYIVSIGICFFGFWQGLGIFQHASVGTVLLSALLYGLTANGVASLPVAQSVLRVVKAKEPK